MATKEQFLNKIAAKLGRDRATRVEPPVFQYHPWDHLIRDRSQSDLVEEWATRLTELGGHVIRIPTAEGMASAVGEFLAQQGMNLLVAWPAPDWVSPDPAEALAAGGVQVSRWRKSGEEDRDRLITLSEQADAGLVYASHGMAETGSIVLYNRGDRGRLVSLFPNQLIAVLRASDIVPRLTQVLALAGKQAADYSCINIITGPSRTSDIEMDLSIGVHGPGRIAVLLIEEA